jgi:hypothetical protein
LLLLAAMKRRCQHALLGYTDRPCTNARTIPRWMVPMPAQYLLSGRQFVSTVSSCCCCCCCC